MGEKIGKLLENVEETDESTEWYCVVGKIQDRFKEKFKGWWGGDCLKYPKQSTCTLEYGINVPARLLIFKLFSKRHALISYSIFIDINIFDQELPKNYAF